jgi:hypothetical protein
MLFAADAQEGDQDFLRQVLEEARTEMDNIVAVAKPELAAARDEAEFRAVMSTLQAGVDAQDEDALMDAIPRAQLLSLDTHRSQAVRDSLRAAQVSLSRIRRCKDLADSGVATVNPSELQEAVALAAGLGYRSKKVEEAKAMLAIVQDLNRRGHRALDLMDREELSLVLQACEDVGLKSPLVQEIRTVIALPVDLFLRRQLAAAVASGDETRVVELTVKMKVRAAASVERGGEGRGGEGGGGVLFFSSNLGAGGV